MCIALSICLAASTVKRVLDFCVGHRLRCCNKCSERKQKILTLYIWGSWVEKLARRNLLLNRGGTSRERQQELDGTGKSRKSPPESMIRFPTDHGADDRGHNTASILPYVGDESITEARYKSRSTLDSVAEFCGEFPHSVNTITPRHASSTASRFSLSEQMS